MTYGLISPKVLAAKQGSRSKARGLFRVHGPRNSSWPPRAFSSEGTVRARFGRHRYEDEPSRNGTAASPSTHSWRGTPAIRRRILSATPKRRDCCRRSDPPPSTESLRQGLAAVLPKVGRKHRSTRIGLTCCVELIQKWRGRYGEILIVEEAAGLKAPWQRSREIRVPFLNGNTSCGTHAGSCRKSRETALRNGPHWSSRALMPLAQ